MSLARRAALLLAASISLPLVPALAADYDPPIYVEPAADEYVPVEVGTGWYLRGDLGYSVNDPYEDKTNNPGFSSSQSPISASIGFGYHFNDYFRADVNLGLLPTSEFHDTDANTTCFGYEETTTVFGTFLTPSSRPCQQADDADQKAYNLMANAYFDLGTYSGFTPYIGGGVGVVYNSFKHAEGAKDCTDDQFFQCSTDPNFYRGSSKNERNYNFAYSLGAGVSYRMTRNTSIDVGYQYLSAPSAEYLRFGNSQGAYRATGLDFHLIQVGLRYDIW